MNASFTENNGKKWAWKKLFVGFVRVNFPCTPYLSISTTMHKHITLNMVLFELKRRLCACENRVKMQHYFSSASCQFLFAFCHRIHSTKRLFPFLAKYKSIAENVSFSSNLIKISKIVYCVYVREMCICVNTRLVIVLPLLSRLLVNRLYRPLNMIHCTNTIYFSCSTTTTITKSYTRV